MTRFAIAALSIGWLMACASPLAPTTPPAPIVREAQAPAAASAPAIDPLPLPAPVAEPALFSCLATSVKHDVLPATFPVEIYKSWVRFGPWPFSDPALAVDGTGALAGASVHAGTITVNMRRVIGSSWKWSTSDGQVGQCEVGRI